VVDEQVVDHQHAPARVGQGGQLVGVGGRDGERLLDEGVLPRLERQLRQRRVGGDRGGDHHRVEVRVLQEVLVPGGEAGLGERLALAVEQALVEVAAPRQPAARQAGEVADEVRPPVVEADHADRDGHP
jgi:hypothetical protein